MHVDSDESWRKQHNSAQEHDRHAKFIDGKGDADTDANLRLESARQYGHMGTTFTPLLKTTP